MMAGTPTSASGTILPLAGDWSAPPAGADSSCAGSTVLVVDDDEVTCQLIAHYLEGLGADVSQAFFGEEALRVMADGGIDLIFNTTEGWQSLKDSSPIRGSALSLKIPYFTTAPASVEAALAIVALSTRSLEVRPLQSYYSHSHT